MDVTIRGAGGGSGGGSKFTTRPDTLRSNDTFEGLLGLCIGPIKGPVSGMQSIRVNETPIEDSSGNENFEDFQASFADGDPLKFPQKAVLRLGAAGAPTTIGVQLRNIGGSAPVWVTRTIDETGAEHIDLRFDVAQLYRQDKNGIYGTTANIEIQMKPVGSTTWINPFSANGNTLPSYDPNGYDMSDGFGSFTRYYVSSNMYNRVNSGYYGSYLTIDGKTTTTEVKEVRIAVPNTGVYADKGWDIRCRLVETESLDDDPNFAKRTIQWESATAVYNSVLGDHEDWRGVAWLQIYGKANDNFNGFPEMDGVYDTKIVSVPPSSVFDPEARTYTGSIWDGSWSKAYTNDPAWVINDVISDSLSGIARLVPGAHLNKWDALELSKYCSELVPDGAGGTHPRFSLNLAVSDSQRSDDFVRWLAGACGATAWDNGDGEWRTVTDKPQATTALFTHENIEGEFVYSHTDVDTRFNEITVVFLNEEFDFREDRIKVEDPDHITRFGRKPTKIIAIGCTNRQQAVRWGILKLRTNVNEYRNVTFTTNRQGKMLERFAWILIADGSLNQTIDDLKRTTGRIVENKGGSVVLGDTMRLELGISYQLHVTVPNPDYSPEPTSEPTNPNWQQPTITVSRAVTNIAGKRGDVREIFLDAPLPGDVAENANVALSALGLPSVPKVYRVVDLDWNDDGERVTVNAMEVDTGKFNAADIADYDFEQPGYNGTGGTVPSPVAPTGGLLTLNSVTGDASVNRVLVAAWRRPPFGQIKGYRIERRLNDGPWIQLGFTTDLIFELANPESGYHEFRVYTIDNHNRASLPLYDDISIDTLSQFAPAAILTNESHTVAAESDGTGFDLSGAGGQFILFTPAGQVVGTDVTFSVFAHDGATASIDTDGTYSITGLTADSATVTFRAVWFDYTIDKIYSITKSRAGVDGTGAASAKLLTLVTTSQTVKYGSTGSPSSGQTIALNALRQNTTVAPTWLIKNLAGQTLAAADAATLASTGLFSSTGSDNLTMTGAQFDASIHLASGALGYPNAGDSKGLTIEVDLTDGITLTDKISIVRVQDGADGSDGTSPYQVTLSLQSLTVAADYTGATKGGALPKTVSVQVAQGTTVLPTSGFSVALTPSDSTAINASYSAGSVSITRVDAPGYIDVQVSIGGTVIATPRIQLSRLSDALPPEAQDSASKSASFGISGAGTSNSFNTTPDVPTLLIKSSPSGVLHVTMAAEYYVEVLTGTNGNFTAAVKAIYRPAGSGGYSDFGASVTGSASVQIYHTISGDTDLTPGTVSLDQTNSGLTADTVYEVGFVFCKVSGHSGDPANGGGSYTAAQS